MKNQIEGDNINKRKFDVFVIINIFRVKVDNIFNSFLI